MAVKRIAIGDNMEAAVRKTVETFRQGGTVVFPTETVYGVGVLSGDAAALDRLRRLKGRSDAKPFQYLVSDVEMARRFGAVFTGGAAKLARNYWPGPLTLVVPDGTGTSTLGIRVPDSPFILAVCRELNRPIVSSSANPAGGEAPLDAAAADVFGDDADLLVDGGPATDGVASTVVRCDAGGYEILRCGGVDAEAIDAAWNE